jgi:hypothetical protein
MESKPVVQPTKKEARNGDLKWHLAHLPSGTDSMFTNYVVPLSKVKAGEQVHAWSELGVQQIQEVINEVFGQGFYTVESNDVWCGLVSKNIPPLQSLT